MSPRRGRCLHWGRVFFWNYPPLNFVDFRYCIGLWQDGCDDLEGIAPFETRSCGLSTVVRYVRPRLAAAPWRALSVVTYSWNDPWRSLRSRRVVGLDVDLSGISRNNVSATDRGPARSWPGSFWASSHDVLGRIRARKLSGSICASCFATC